MNTRYITAIAAAALVLSGCNRDEIVPGASGDGYLKLEVAGVQTVTAVKGALYNSEKEMLDDELKEFTVQAWNADCSPFVTEQSATYDDDSKWSLTPSVQWTGEDTKTFFAYANLPGGATVTNTFKSDDKSQKLEITSLPTDARQQNDIMLGYYSGDGKVDGKDAHTAQIQFYHPLTAVKICDGGIFVKAINRITLSGIYASGTVTVTYKPGGDGKIAPEYEWGSRTGKAAPTLEPKSGEEFEIDPVTKVIGVPFVVIPQDVAAGKVRITLDVTVNDDESKTLAVDVPATTWTAGHTKSYILSYGSETSYALSITEWDSETYPVELEEEQSDLLTFIDLGLPSGTLWADRNIGAESVKDEPTCCGDYYAWSMTETYYDQASSNPPVDIVWKDAYSNGYAQYAWPAEKYNATDGLKKLELTDDVANVVLGNDARIPSVAQWNELIANCKITKTNNGGHGYVTLTSKLNDASIILPAAGFYSVKENTNYGNFGVYYMTSELYSDISQIYALWCGASENLQCKGGYSRFAGLPVRAVKPGPVKIGGVYWATKNVGAKTVAGSPSTSYGDYFAWGETEPYYSSISFNNASSATIGWKEDYKTKGYDWVNYKYCDGTDKTLTKYNTDAVCGNIDNKTVLESSDDAATANWGSSWRMPTYEDFKNLYKACTDKAENAAPESLPETITKGGVYWSDSYDGVAGILFVDKLDISKRVFFPAAGYFCEGTSFIAGGSIAAYWSSSLLDGSRNAHNMRFSTATVNPSYPTGARQYGFPVRPVKDAD